MSLFETISFGPSDIRSFVADGGTGTLPRCVRVAILTTQTCGETCWHAAEDVCRCSCGGRNHGCLTIDGAVRPVRTAKIDGERYALAGVGLRSDLIESAKAINGSQWRSVESAQTCIESRIGDFTEAEVAQARASGLKVWFSQYRYHWNETDAGAPARMKYATRDQLAKWSELSGWQDRASEGVCLLWKIETMPPAPAIMIVDRHTGLPLANQSPLGPQV
jgi:hypothetical protein